jgi:hypothetical protein
MYSDYNNPSYNMNKQNINPVSSNIFVGQQSKRIGSDNIYQQSYPRDMAPLAQQSYEQSLNVFRNDYRIHGENINPVNPNIFGGQRSIPIERYTSPRNIAPLAQQSYEQSFDVFRNDYPIYGENINPVNPNIFGGQRSFEVEQNYLPRDTYEQYYSPYDMQELTEDEIYQITTGQLNNNKQNITPINPNVYIQRSKL